MADAGAQREDPNELAMRHADVELRRRRERGRQSQARFRKKQAQVFQDMLEENERLKATIAGIVKATKSTDPPGLLAAINAAADVAGVDGSNLNVENREIVVEGPEVSLSSDSHSASKGSWDRTLSSMGQILSRRPKSPVDRSSDGGWRSSGTARSSSSGRLSPRLDYGIWFDASREVRITKPPSEITAYIGAGRYTFAGHLYWACTDYLISLCRLATMPYSLSLRPDARTNLRLNPREAEDRVWSVMRHSPPVPSVHLALALAEAQREFRDTGYIRGDSPASDEGLCSLMREKVEADYLTRGHDLRAWMTITQLEEHVRRQLGKDAFSRLERAIANSSKAVHGGPIEDLNVQPIVRLLIKNLAESYVCFGDGPRWRADSVSTLFSETKAI
ncbi:hypothetical protein GGR51DRAFT_270536 [Nemania sp. FL0031]|nr:hypothetical protein GGR51DRAFT_270536 [Nemania sp. FL0031]